MDPVWAVPRSLATTRGMFSLPRGTEMFQFPRLPPLDLCIQSRVLECDLEGVTPFGNPRLERLLTACRGLSQPTTSFFGLWRQGIHHTPLLAFSRDMIEFFSAFLSW